MTDLIVDRSTTSVSPSLHSSRTSPVLKDRSRSMDGRHRNSEPPPTQFVITPDLATPSGSELVRGGNESSFVTCPRYPSRKRYSLLSPTLKTTLAMGDK